MEASPRKSTRFALAALVVYAISLALPVWTDTRKDVPPPMLGAEVFVGFLGLSMCGPTFIVELPNVTFVVGLLLLVCQKWLGAVICGLLGVTGGFVVGYMVCLEWHDGTCTLASGYYVWIASMALLTVASALRSR